MAKPRSPTPPGRGPCRFAVEQTARRGRLGRLLAIILTLAVVAAGVATYVILTSPGPLGSLVSRRVIGAADLVLLLLLAALVAGRVIQMWLERRKGAAGSRMHVRLVFMFSLVAVTPAIVLAILSALLIQFWIQGLVGTSANTAIEELNAVANAYLQEHQQVISGDALAMANDLSRDGMAEIRSPLLLEQMVSTQAALRSLTEAAVFDSSGQVLAHAGLAYSLEASIPQIPQWAYDRAKAGEVAVLPSADNDRVRALTLLQPGVDRDLYLYVGRFVDPRVLGQIERTNRATAEYEQQKGSGFTLELTFTGIYIVVACLLLLGAIWAGFSLATQLATPIVGLIDAAERVREGDLSARVETRDEAAGDELDTLSRAFNRMTSQLATQRAELVETNRELDERRRFSEAVLAGVTAGRDRTGSGGQDRIAQSVGGRALVLDRRTSWSAADLRKWCRKWRP